MAVFCLFLTAASGSHALPRSAPSLRPARSVPTRMCAFDALSPAAREELVRASIEFPASSDESLVRADAVLWDKVRGSYPSLADQSNETLAAALKDYYASGITSAPRRKARSRMLSHRSS